MIRLSMEIPTAYLAAWSSWTDLDFALAHRVLEDEEYTAFYAERPPWRECILDNSMHELGYPLTVRELRRAASLIHADTVIAPDQLGEPERNLGWYRETHAALGDEFKIGAVLAGRSRAERWTYLDSVADANMILLPFREPRLSWYHEQADRIQAFPRVHLLGVSELEELWCCNQVAKNHWTVDTSKPVKWGIERKLISELRSLRNAPTTSRALLDVRDLSESQLQHIEENVSHLRRFIA